MGKVVEQTGPTEIVRNKQSTPSAVDSPVEINDTIITARARAQIVFSDATTVKISEQSTLVIDEFVYDPAARNGKLGMRVALGTARYASGQIAKNNPHQVSVKTPTATIAVRGTDFSMTVDEMGRSLVILLPSCDSRTCVTGAIEVITSGGKVFLDSAFQATLVVSDHAPPSDPVQILIDQENINNLLIVAPPAKLRELDFSSSSVVNDVTVLDTNILDVNELDQDFLEKIKEIDISLLDSEQLMNLIDLANQKVFSTPLDSTSKILPNYDKNTGLLYYFNADETKITLLKSSSKIARITLDATSDATATINQQGVEVIQRVNQGGTTSITIIQN